MSPRTETSYKAERPGEVAPHTEAQGSGRTVDGGVVQLQFAFLSGEIWVTGRSPQCIDAPAAFAGSASYSAVESADGGNIVGDGPEVSRGHSRCRICRALDRQRETNSTPQRLEAATAPKDRTVESGWTGTAHRGVDADRLSLPMARWPEKSLKPRPASGLAECLLALPLYGTAVCGPARTVVWGPGARAPRLPD